MKQSLELRLDQVGPMEPEEIRRRLKRLAHGTVVELIARCSDRRKQQLLIDTWNDPWTFEDFAERSAEIGNESGSTALTILSEQSESKRRDSHAYGADR